MMHRVSDSPLASPTSLADEFVEWWARWRRSVYAIAAVLAVLLLARSSLASHYVIPTGSMRPTVEIGDRIFANKLAYGLRLPWLGTYVAQFRTPERSHVVVLESPEDGTTLLKRIVAIPGDHVLVREGRVWLNGAPAPLAVEGELTVEHLGANTHPVWVGPGPGYGPTVIPEGHYLVLGDNRGDSRDGRSFGLVRGEAILGQAVGVWWRHGLTWRQL
jgi:signal peptidase I